MRQGRTARRYGSRAAAVTATLLFVAFAGSLTSADRQDAAVTGRTPIPAARIVEKVIAEARRGSDIVIVRVMQTGSERHVAWVEQSKGTKTVWLDGTQLGGVYDDVKYVAFRAATSDLIVVSTRSSKWTLRAGDQEYAGDFRKITAFDLGPEDEVVAGVCRGTECRLQIDGRETGPTYEDIDSPDFSPEGDHLMYFAKRNKKWVTVLDGKETGPGMDDWLAHRWSHDGKRLAVAGVVGGNSTWVVDGTPGPTFDAIGEIAFSRDGQHYAYGGAGSSTGFAKQQVVGSIVVDGKEIGARYAGRGMLGAWTWLGGASQLMRKGLRQLSADFHGVSDPEYTGSGELVFAQRLADGQVMVRIGDRPGPVLDDLVSSIVVSTNGEHVGYIGTKGETFVEVRDQVDKTGVAAGRKVAFIPWITISNDGQLTYSTARGGAEFKEGRSGRALRRAVIGGIAEPEYDSLGLTLWIASKTRDQHAYVVHGAEGDRDRLILNGRETGLYDDVLSGTITFVPDGSVEFVARQGTRLLLVTISPQ